MSKTRKSLPAAAPERLLTVADVADLLQVSTRTVRRLIDAGDLKVLRIGRAVRVRMEDLRSYLDSS